jgi:hypothetical protein
MEENARGILNEEVWMLANKFQRGALGHFLTIQGNIQLKCLSSNPRTISEKSVSLTIWIGTCLCAVERPLERQKPNPKTWPKSGKLLTFRCNLVVLRSFGLRALCFFQNLISIHVQVCKTPTPGWCMSHLHSALSETLPPMKHAGFVRQPTKT